MTRMYEIGKALADHMSQQAEEVTFTIVKQADGRWALRYYYPGQAINVTANTPTDCALYLATRLGI